MEIALILKVAGVGILISVLNMILDKVDRKDWVTLTTLVGIVIVLGLVITEISDLFNTVRTMFQLYFGSYAISWNCNGFHYTLHSYKKR